MKYGDNAPTHAFATGTTFNGNQFFPSDILYLKTRGALHARGLIATGSGSNNVTSSFTSLGAAPRSLSQRVPSVIAGGYQACAYIWNTQLYTWGVNTTSVLGRTVSAGEPEGIPLQVAGSWSKIAIGNGFMVGIRTNGTLWSWGSNALGKTGQNTAAGTTTVPTQIGVATDWKMVACCPDGTIAIKNDNTVWAFGAGTSTGLNMSSGNVLVPTQVTAMDGLGEITWVSASHSQANFAIVVSGKLYTTGNNTNYMTGLGTTTGTTLTFTQVGTATNWAKCFMGETYAAALNTSGHVFGYGIAANWTTGNPFGNSPNTAATAPTVRHMNTAMFDSIALCGNGWSNASALWFRTDGTIIHTGYGSIHGLTNSITTPVTVGSFSQGGTLTASRSGAIITTYDLAVMTSPTSLVATQLSSGGIALSWADLNISETEFRVYRSTTPINTQNPGDPYLVLPANSVSVSDTNVPEGETFYYVVSAYREGDESERFSNQASATGGAVVPGPNFIFGSALEAMYDTSSANLTVVSGKVTEWKNSATNYTGRNMTQTSTSAQPVILPGALAGLDVLRFDGTDFFRTTSTWFPSGHVVAAFVATPQRTLPGSATIDSVWGTSSSYTDDGATVTLYNGFGNTSSYNLGADGSTSRNQFLNGSAAVANTGVTKGTFLVGATQFTDHPTNKAWNIASFRGGQYPGVIDMAELIILKGTDAANATMLRQKAEGFLAWKYGLAANLPADHPYKNGAPTS